MVSSRSNRPSRQVLLASLGGLQVLLLVGGSVGAVRIGGQSHRLPTFALGGAFVREGSPPDTGRTSAPATGAAVTDPAGARTAADTPGPSTTISTRPGLVTARQPSLRPGAGPTHTEPSGPALPALGTYTYSVSGQESSTGFGTRSFPSTMTIDVHKGSGLPADEVVLDITFSAQHQEREILQYTQGGIAMIYEAGAVTFGPMTQTNQATYVPPMQQVPLPDGAGAQTRGTSVARNSDGSTDRVEDWTTSVQGMEAVRTQSGYRQCPVIRVDRRTRPGSADQETRRVSYRYDPGLGIWDRWSVLMHAQRSYVGFTFTYDESFTATLSDFQPG